MSPLDGELRRALSDRAVRVEPAADPLDGIERRARSMRRNRLASVAASVALLVGGAAVAVPAVIDATGTDAAPEVRLSPTPPPSTPAAPVPGALDPASPWAYRGTDSVRTGFAPEVQTVWEQEHPGSTITPLFGRVFVSSAQPELVFVASGPDGDRWGFAQRTTNGGTGPAQAVVTEDRDLPDGTTALVLTLGADEGGSTVLVVAHPRAAVSYSGQGDADQTQMAVPVEGVTGVGIQFRGGDLSRDRVRVDLDGTRVYDEAIAPGQQPSPTAAPSAGPPANAVSWPLRGALTSGPDLEAATAAFAAGLGASPEDVVFRPLLATDVDGGLRLVAGQAWVPGGRAHAVSYAVGGGCPASPFIGAPIPEDAGVLAFALSCVPGRTTDTVMVVPQPQTGQVSYGAEGSEYRPLEFLPGLEPVVELERDASPARGTDRLQVLDGDGDRDDPVYDGPLDALLCGIKECG